MNSPCHESVVIILGTAQVQTTHRLYQQDPESKITVFKDAYCAMTRAPLRESHHPMVVLTYQQTLKTLKPTKKTANIQMDESTEAL